MSLKSRLLCKIMENATSSGFFSGLLAFLYLVKTASDRYPVVYNCRDYTSNIYVRYLLNLLVLPAGICKYFFHGDISREDRDGLAIVLIAKNEADYIQEWLDFHIKQGASHFAIYDNDSTDNFLEVLQPYIDSGIVTYKKISGKKRQIDVYNMALDEYKHKFKYMAVLDADEFVFVREKGVNLCAFLDNFMSRYKNAGGIAVNWLIFGSSGIEKKPDGGVLENFVMCAEKDFSRNHFVKTICEPSKVLGWGGVHCPIYYRGFYNLNENGEISNYTRTKKVSFEKIRINHYFSKSKEEFLRKKARGMADVSGERPMEDFYVHDQNELQDTEILSHV